MLELNTFLVKERVGFIKLLDVYDIWDPATGRQVGEARETPEPWQKWLRLVVDKHFLPTAVSVTGTEASGSPGQFGFRKPFSFLRSRAEVFDAGGRPVGTLVSKLFSLGGGFRIYDPGERLIAEMSGDWKGWNFTVKDSGGRQWGAVTKQWAGLGKELLTSADNYVVDAAGAASRDEKILVLASALALDTVFKERK